MWHTIKKKNVLFIDSTSKYIYKSHSNIELLICISCCNNFINKYIDAHSFSNLKIIYTNEYFYNKNYKLKPINLYFSDDNDTNNYVHWSIIDSNIKSNKMFKTFIKKSME